MRKLVLFASAAAMAAAMPALADAQGQGKGQGKGGDSAQVERGGGPDRAERGRGNGRQAEARRGGRSEDRGNRGKARGERRGNADRAEGRGNAGRGERRAGNGRRAVERAERNARGADNRRDRDVRLPGERVVREARRGSDRDWSGWMDRRPDGDRFRPARAGVGPAGCPPGLAKQNAFCMPPGQLRKAQMIGQRAALSDFGFVPERYRYRFSDDDRYLYRYDDGSIFRIGRSSGLIDSVFPVLSNGLYLGEPMPLGYEVYNVPLAYRSQYPYGADSHYRYDDSAIYRVNPETRLVEGIVALLTGGVGGLGGLGIGDPLPAGYDAYNVPLDYRDQYYDTDDAMYRYADGYVYQVDPQTRLIEAVISLFT